MEESEILLQKLLLTLLMVTAFGISTFLLLYFSYIQLYSFQWELITIYLNKITA